ncbi:hypothetical protein FHS81_002618 [Pseudochelatococcus contaminans]|uniref:Uncharacterized protein n=1 Tax=Pseudochelatococcus contaminans TaxID=1538103 RepID=A0A7W6EI97_9HYPH|nr:hypothetical protein [Pseudochelatococcus contaminans]
MRRDCPTVVVCGHGAGKAVRFVNAAGNFVGLLAEQAFASILERDDPDNNASSSFVIIFTKSSRHRSIRRNRNCNAKLTVLSG